MADYVSTVGEAFAAEAALNIVLFPGTEGSRFLRSRSASTGRRTRCR